MVNACHPVPELSSHVSTLVDLLSTRSLHQLEQPAFTFLQNGEIEAVQLTYRELDQQSRAIAAQLQALGLCRERALLLYPPGLEYLAAFFGCLYAGVVAVPAYPPLNRRNAPRILAIASDAQAAIALTTTTILPKVRSLLMEKAALEKLRWLTTDDLDQTIASNWQVPTIASDTLAFLQYTSGSTGAPKGVMLSHGNLLHNAAVTYELMGHSLESVFVSWLPVYHDMGLIGGILQPLYGGFPCILMPPAAFLQRPYRWLQTISQYRGTTSGGPNFAYELCLEKIAAEQRQSLDLSCWKVAFNGAEPVRSQTLERFAAEFADCGFRRETFYPCYGMAETTLMVSGGHYTQPPVIQTVQKMALEQHRIVDAAIDISVPDEIQSLVGCGRIIPQQQSVIAHPETLTRCAPDEVGEIWVSGPSVGQGYWQRPEETAQIFRAHLANTGEGPFLRTGDLGFLQDGELFVTGRVKDLIIIRGRNLYPQDIELITEHSHPSLRLGSGAAFAVEVEGEERLVVVQELEFRAKPDIEEVTSAIRQAITEEYEVQVYGVVLIKPGSIPKTTSGKIQRRACKAKFLDCNLSVIGSSILEVADFVETTHSLNRDALLALPPRESHLLLETYLQGLVAQVLKVAPVQVNPHQPLSSLGLDSLIVFDLKNRIEVDLGVAIPVALFFQGTNIAQIAGRIIDQLTDSTLIIPTLQPIPRQGNLPLSLVQERLWFLEQLEPGNPFYNVAIAILLTGSLNVSKLEQSLNKLVKRHEALRTRFVAVKGQPVQVIASSLTLTLPVVELPGLSEVKALDFATEEAQQPFDLSRLPLLRPKLLCLNEEKHMLILSMHHIISDGWSIGILIRELAVLYEAFSNGKSSPLPELPIQYADFAYWQQQCWQGEVFKTQLDYWKQQLRGDLPVLQLPIDRERPTVQTFSGKKHFFNLPKDLFSAVQSLNNQEGVTLFMTLLAVFKTLLFCYSNQEDMIVGSPIAGRNRTETEGIIGFFINTLVLRTDMSGNPSFRQLLGRVQKTAVEAYTHQDVPFEKLVEELQPKRNLSQNPIFQVMFILQNASIPEVETLPETSLQKLTLRPLEVDCGTSKFDLKLSLWESREGLKGSLEYKTDLFDTTTIAGMMSNFETLLCQVVRKPEIRLNELAAIIAEANQKQQQTKEKEIEATSWQKLKLTKRTAIRRA